jgi:ElaB/YqjD/DUF883 family membrane-anchored ribosome-binding protein
MITMSEPNLEPTSQSNPAATPAVSTSAATGLWQRVEQLVVEHPKHSLAVAAAAGVVLGWIIKRRR